MRLSSIPAATVIALLLAAGCGAGTPPAAPSAAAVLAAAATRAEQTQRFHFLLEHERGATTIVRGIQMTRAEGDVDGPDRVQATVKGLFSGLNFDLGLVILGPDAWLQNPLTRRWEREAITVRQFFDPGQGVVAMLRRARDPQFVGTETIGTERAYRVDATLDAADVAMLPGTPLAGRLSASAWIGVADAAVLRVELRGAAIEGDAEELLRRLTLTRHGEDVRIEPPR